MILQKNSSQASSKISSSGKDSNTADVIDNLMKSTKSALEEVELPSESRRDHQTGMCNFGEFFLLPVEENILAQVKKTFSLQKIIFFSSFWEKPFFH